MSNKTKAAKATTATATVETVVVDVAKVATITTTLEKAVGTFITSFATLAKAVEDAVEAYRAAGLDDKQTAEAVRAAFDKAGQRKNVNRYLRAAGVRSRGLRCDAGLSGFLLRFGSDAPKKAEDKPAVKPAVRLGNVAIRLADGDKAKAIASLRAAIKAIEAMAD